MRKKLMRDKRTAIVDDVLPILMFVLIAGLLLLFFINTNAALNRKTTLNQIARKYMLTMETQGYLYPEDIAALKTELTKNGYYASATMDADYKPVTTAFGDVDVASGHGYSSHVEGTNIYATESYIGYGNPIELTLDVYCQTWISIGDYNVFKPRLGKTMNRMVIQLNSIAKN